MVTPRVKGMIKMANTKKEKTVFKGTIEELEDFIKNARELQLQKIKEEGKEKEKNIEDLSKVKELFYQWKEKVDKIMKENNIDKLYSEKEFYDHLIALNDWVNDGKKFEDIFGDAEKELTCNYLIITYDIIEDIMEAIKDCCYHFEQYQEDWLFKNEKVMFIDSSIGYSLYNNDEYYKIDMN